MCCAANGNVTIVPRCILFNARHRLCWLRVHPAVSYCTAWDPCPSTCCPHRCKTAGGSPCTAANDTWLGGCQSCVHTTYSSTNNQLPSSSDAMTPLAKQCHSEPQQATLGRTFFQVPRTNARHPLTRWKPPCCLRLLMVSSTGLTSPDSQRASWQEATLRQMGYSQERGCTHCYEGPMLVSVACYVDDCILIVQVTVVPCNTNQRVENTTCDASAPG